jgi:hypothetical protein
MTENVHYPIQINYPVELILLIEVAFDKLSVEYFVVMLCSTEGFSRENEVKVY